MTSPFNYTIDDSQWATPAVYLSDGWNMLRINGSNEWVNQTQVQEITPLLSNFWNGSLSWTTTENASTTLVFTGGSYSDSIRIGTDIWAYGMAGPDQGGYTAVLDRRTIGEYTARADTIDYEYLLFAAHDLNPGVKHELTLVNGAGGSMLAFDMAWVTSPGHASVATSSASTSPHPSAVETAQSSTGNSTMEEAIAADEQKLAGQWSDTQLAFLAKKYRFDWTPAAYFVVTACALVAAVFLALIVTFSVKLFIAKRRNERFRAVGTSYLMDGESTTGAGSGNGQRPRPATRIAEALKGGKISRPIPSEDGHSILSGKIANSTETGYKEEAVHEW